MFWTDRSEQKEGVTVQALGSLIFLQLLKIERPCRGHGGGGSASVFEAAVLGGSLLEMGACCFSLQEI